LVDELVETVKAWVGRAVNVVPPIADEVLLQRKFQIVINIE
jgi:hypothetical protein